MFSHEQLVRLLRALPDPAFILTRSGRYAAVFGGSDARYYHDGSGLVGQRIADVLNEEKAAWFLAEIERTLVERKLRVVEYGLAGSDVKGLGNDGPSEPIRFEGRIQALDFQVDDEDAVLWVASNITVRHALEQQLRDLSETDALTGLHNRRHFEKTSAAEMERSARYDQPLSLLIFDIDHFKVINDTRGHKAGDDVLIELARLIEERIRGADVLTRWGGEEFTVLLPSTTLEMALATAEKLRRAVEEHSFPAALKLTVSLGAAEWAGVTETLDSLLSRADEAMYRAKRAGRNRVAIAARTGDGLPGQALAPLLRWHPRYECGSAAIDTDHRQLFDDVNDVNRLLAAPEAGARSPATLAALERLLDHTRAHFEAEEHVLAELGWSELDAHRGEHRRLLMRARELVAALAAHDEPVAPSALVDFLTVELVANHVLRSDRRYFARLAAR